MLARLLRPRLMWLWASPLMDDEHGYPLSRRRPCWVPARRVLIRVPRGCWRPRFLPVAAVRAHAHRQALDLLAQRATGMPV